MRFATAALISLLTALPAIAQAPKVEAGPFDPSRNVAADLKAAEVQAQQSGRRILLDVGGNWCSWCRLMDKWYGEHADVRAFRDQHFVVVMVNFSAENENEAALSQYPKITGYPHFFVLDANGKLLQSQDTGLLEDGHGYSPAKMMAFLQAWSGK